MNEVPMPTPDEKQRSIAYVLQNAPERPKGFLESLFETVRALGIKGLFFGVEDAAFIAILAVFLIGTAFLTIPKNQLFSALFFLSPFAYAILHSLTIWKETLSGTWGLKMTCRITSRHLSALRMFCFGGVSMLTNAFLSGALFVYSQSKPSLLRLLGVSFGSLFLFATLLLLFTIKFHDLIAQAFCTVFWCVFGAIAYTVGGDALERVLLSLPLALLLGGSIALFVLFVIEIRIYFAMKNTYSYY